jgi:nucleoside 2-deoxyribosyltransferase
MRVYISSHDRESAQTLAKTLAEAGHMVVSDWHDGEMSKPADREEWQARASHNFARIRQSDALVLIGGTDCYPGGKYVEAGYAYGIGTPVYNLGEVGNGMMHFAEHARDIPALIAALEETR